MIQINVCKEFSETLGARYRSDGPFSGEEFREDLLEPRYLEAVSKQEKLEVNLDGGYGLPTSFLEEAFGGLARKYGSESVKNTLEFISNDEPEIIEDIVVYIEEAEEGED